LYKFVVKFLIYVEEHIENVKTFDKEIKVLAQVKIEFQSKIKFQRLIYMYYLENCYSQKS